MNKKVIQAILIVGVLCVWGLVGYRLLKSNDSESAYSLPATSLVYSKQSQVNEVDKNLALNYDDPFLRQTAIRVRNTTQILPDKSANKLKVKPVDSQSVKEVWPDLIYKGLISNKKNSSQLAIVSISGTEKIVSVGSQFNDFEVKSISIDEIALSSHCGSTRVYKRKNV